ncbi:hypothetical protein BASA83_004569 [Batrachochytrium salamandrivorans]|nr:hypothetical protein BASA83_004569 [Batrachochytrium salamandrivorans]
MTRNQRNRTNQKKKSFLSSRRRRNVHTKDLSKDDPHSDPNTSDDTKEGTTDFPVYDPSQNDGAKERGGNGYTSLDSDQERSSSADASQDSSSRVLSHIRNGLSPEKLGARLIINEYRLLIATERMQFGLGGRKGDKIGSHVYKMLKYALKVSHNYKILYKDSAKSPFSLELPSAISDKSKETYRRLQDDVLGCIENHISVINIALKSIGGESKSVSLWLKEVMEKTDDFYKFI